MVKASVNEINSKDDAVVKKLKREVQHLKELLNLRRNKNDHDIQRELLSLKEQNYRLRELASKGQQVDVLIKENNKLRLELKRFNIPQISDGFIVWQNAKKEIPTPNNPMNHTYFDFENKKENIFLTETEVDSNNVSQFGNNNQ